MAVHPTLIIEVLEAIIDQAGDDTESLRCLSLTCSTLLPRARHHLFRNLTIRTMQKLESSVDFLESHPWIRLFIKKVTLSVDLHYDYSHRTVPLLAVIPVHLLSQLPNLRSWRMGIDVFVVRNLVHLSLHRCTLSRYKRFAGHVHDLELFSIAFDDVSDFVGLVSSFTGIQTITCSRIWFRTTEQQESVLSPRASRTGLLSRPPKFTTVHLCTSVDIRAAEYLLDSSPSTLDALTLTIDAPQFERPDYFQRLERLLSGLSHPSSLTYVILGYNWEYRDDGHIRDQTLVDDIRRATRILECISRTCLRNVRVAFEMDRIDSLARCISWSDAPLEPCKELERVLLTFPFFSVVFHATKVEHRGRRAEFWKREVKRAFPRLNERGLLVFPHTIQPDIVTDPPAHESSVKCLIASHDNKWIVSASSDGTIIIWDTERGTIAHEWLAHRGPVLGLSLSPDGRQLVSAGGVGHGALAVWNIGDTVSQAASLEGHTQALTSCAWSSDGALIASASEDEAVRVWDAPTFHQRDVLEPGERETLMDLQSLRFSPDGRYLAWISKSPPAALGSDVCSLWRHSIEEQPKRFGRSSNLRHRDLFNALSFDPEGSRIATARASAYGRHEEDVVQIWDVGTGAELATLAGHTKGLTDVSFSPDGKLLLSTSADSTAKIWDAGSGDQIASFKVERWAELRRACFSPDGKHVATAALHGDAKVRLWRVEDGACVAAFPEHGWSVQHVAFTPNGEFLASGDAEGMVYIRRVSNILQH